MSTTPASTPSGSPTTTQAPSPVVQTTAAPSSGGRKFDGASFIGGIILGSFLTAICFLAYIWWQKRNKSYHSL